jgi:hypothetical protein
MMRARTAAFSRLPTGWGRSGPRIVASTASARAAEKLVAGADASAGWYERFAEHMRLAPRDFAWSYIQRSGRVDPEKLRKIAPRFVAG